MRNFFRHILGIPMALVIMLSCLKIAGVLLISWVWVIAPIWIPFIAIIICVMALVTVGFILDRISK